MSRIPEADRDHERDDVLMAFLGAFPEDRVPDPEIVTEWTLRNPKYAKDILEISLTIYEVERERNVGLMREPTEAEHKEAWQRALAATIKIEARMARERAEGQKNSAEESEAIEGSQKLDRENLH